MIVWPHLGTHGRTGNALYQFASTVALGERYGEPVRFNADWTHRPYFSVPDSMFGDVTGGTPAGEVYARTLEPGPTTDWRTAYLQDFALIAPYLPLIREYLAPSPAALAILDGPECAEFNALPRPICSLHVRRGDNIIDPGVPNKHLYWPVPPLSYYQQAIDRLRQDMASVAVFSDDIEWCRTALPGFAYYHCGVPRPKENSPDFYSAPVLDWIDLQLQARCSKHVLSNSTFGWWGAMLADTRRAIYPWPIVGPALPEVNMLIALPSYWQLLEYETSALC